MSVFCRTFGRDMRVLGKYIDILYHMWTLKRRQATVAKVFTNHAKTHPEKVAFYFEDQTWTFQDVEKFSNKIANYFKSQGYRRGDTVALLFENGPEFVCMWLGLSKIGVKTALINNQLCGDPLVYSIKEVEAKGLIYGFVFQNVIESISGRLENVQLYEFSEEIEDSTLDDAKNLKLEMTIQSDASPSEEIEEAHIQDVLIFIYTSGTTGLPKAVPLTNFKYLLVCTLIRDTKVFKKGDIVYNPLPLYHSAGGIFGVGHSLAQGNSVVLRKSFSSSQFWADCIKYKCTASLYIGEICRYLLAHHRNDEQKIEHSVETFLGSGLKPQIWNQFVTKFNIKRVYELYGSTEGNTNIVNFDNTPGSIGFVPFWAKLVYPVTLVKCDLATTEPIRTNGGFCQRCQIGEPGLMLGKIVTKTTMVEFSGYVDKVATEKKLLRNVFKDGDVYFNSGDILEMDELGYFYFRDRIGDTFRWKGENVSTTEVEAVISNLMNLNDAVVYGVEVPDTDGRVGMAAIVQNTEAIDMAQLGKKLKENLPSYAIPRFVRIVPSISLTGTFKMQKVQLQKEGFDVREIKDGIFFYDAANVAYVELTKEKYDDIMCGNVRL